MTQGRSIRLFLVDGAPNGLLTAEIMNWTGHVLTGPRSKLSEIFEGPEGFGSRNSVCALWSTPESGTGR